MADGIFTWEPNGVPPAFALADAVPPSVGVSQWIDSPAPIGPLRQRPIPRPSRVAFAGLIQRQYGELFWFDHIHIIPQQIALGNVLSDLTRTFEVYNGYRSASKTISSFVMLNAEGLTITAGDSTPPVVIPPNASEQYTVAVSRLGPARLAATFNIVMASGESLTLQITGTRAVLWVYVPQAAFSERHEFKTWIFDSDNGSEQRQALRDRPRQTFGYRYLFGDERISARAENLLADWYGRVFGLPLWQDATTLTSPLSAGATTLNVDSTVDRDFRSGAGELVMLYAGEFSFDVLEVESFTATQVVVSLGSGSTWPAGTVVLPVRLTYLVGTPEQINHSTKVRDLSMSFELITSASVADDSAFTAYLGDPVWLDPMLAPSKAQSRSYVRPIDRLDSQVGRVFQESERRITPAVFSFGADFETRTEFWRLKRFLHARRGRTKRFWIPSWRQDFEIHSTTTTGSVTLIVRAAKYADHAFTMNTTARKHIVIEYANGARDFREVTGATLTTPGVLETLTISPALSQDASAANVRRICYLHRVRLASDEIAFEHGFANNGFVNLSVSEAHQ